MSDYAKKMNEHINNKNESSTKSYKAIFKDSYDINDNNEEDLYDIQSNEETSYTKSELAKVQSYYNEHILNTEQQRKEKFALYVCICSIIAVITLSYITLSVGTSYKPKPIIYKADHVVDTIKQPVILKNQEPLSATPPVIPNKTEPTIVNNYNFEKLNTGLISLGYCLLICFATFFGIKGFNLLGKSFKIKNQIKKSKNLIKEFNNAVGNGNYIAISQEINEQLLMNNILIERFNNNANVIELMTVTERLKDVGMVINKNILTDIQYEK